MHGASVQISLWVTHDIDLATCLFVAGGSLFASPYHTDDGAVVQIAVINGLQFARSLFFFGLCKESFFLGILQGVRAISPCAGPKL